MLAILDAGTLYAAVDTSDQDHEPCLSTLRRGDLQLIIPALVVAEVAYLGAGRLGSVAESAFARGLRMFDVEAPVGEDWARIGDLIEQYASFPLGAADASVIALAERVGTDLLITLDQRHFRAVRPLHVPAFRLLPE